MSTDPDFKLPTSQHILFLWQLVLGNKYAFPRRYTLSPWQWTTSPWQHSLWKHNCHLSQQIMSVFHDKIPCQSPIKHHIHVVSLWDSCICLFRCISNSLHLDSVDLSKVIYWWSPFGRQDVWHCCLNIWHMLPKSDKVRSPFLYLFS